MSSQHTFNSEGPSLLQWEYTTWVPMGSDIYGDIRDFSSYLHAVSLSHSGTRIPIGSPFGGGGANGLTRVYEWVSDEWVQVGHNLQGASNSNSGFSISLSGDGTRPVFGELRDGPGSVRISDWNGTTWNIIGNDFFGEGALSDAIGYSVSLSGDGQCVFIGAR